MHVQYPCIQRRDAHRVLEWNTAPNRMGRADYSQDPREIETRGEDVQLDEHLVQVSVHIDCPDACAQIQRDGVSPACLCFTCLNLAGIVDAETPTRYVDFPPDKDYSRFFAYDTDSGSD